MIYLPIAIVSFFLNSVAVTVDKLLLTKTIRDPLLYVFYFSLVSLLVLLIFPFIQVPTTNVLVLASLSTLFWTLAAYLMFKALQIGLLQRVIPVIGTLTPLFLLIFARREHSISPSQTWAVIFLLSGLILLNLGYFKGRIKINELILSILSALFFAVSYFLLRLAFLEESFLSVFVYSRPILIPLGIILFLIPQFRRKILQFQKNNLKIQNPAVWLFAAGQISAAASELLLIFAISLASPAIVNSLQGIKYIFLMIFSLVLGKKYPEIFVEKTSLMITLAKFLGIVSIIIGLYLLSLT
ncbi:MAG: hypothetical protein Q8P92_01050 [Candidatus Daviesbacteria bacterium]|nr:hypothetical protein [Candidatus Daviesbacteria bacterium]